MKHKMLMLALAIYGMLFFSCERMDMAEPGLLVPKTVDQDASLPSLMINGFLLHVESFGNPNDPIVIIVHGGPGGDYRSMLNATNLVSNGYFVVFYDQFGAGLSQRVDKSILDKEGSIDIYIENLNALINHFRLTATQKVFLAGHSWGAMLASGFVNKYPEKIDGLVLAEPGGLTWTQTDEYLSRSNHIEFFSEALNNAIYPEQILAGRNEDEILDYKASFFSSFENAPGNTVGNAGMYPFWRQGAVVFNASIDYAYKYNFDFKSNLGQYNTEILFLYSEYNKAYGKEWAETVSEPFANKEIQLVHGSGHEMFYFGWDDMYPKIVSYLNKMR